MTIFYGHIYKNKPVPLNPSAFNVEMHKFKEGDEIQIEVKKREKKRTSPQNAYMHQLFTILRKEFNKLGNNFTDEDVKNMCKLKFLKYSVADKDDVFIADNIRHTSSLSTAEMNIFIEQIKSWAAEFDIYLSDPGEQIKIGTT